MYEGYNKLELGSGKRPAAGYYHTDILCPMCAKVKYPNLELNYPHIEQVLDASKPLPFPDECFDEILAKSILEHISFGGNWNSDDNNIITTLKEWRRVLEIGGVLRLIVPNLRAVFLCREAGEIPDDQYVSYQYGALDYPYNIHKIGFDPPLMEKTLKRAGFHKEVKFYSVEYDKNCGFKTYPFKEKDWEMGVEVEK